YSYDEFNFKNLLFFRSPAPFGFFTLEETDDQKKSGQDGYVGDEQNLVGLGVDQKSPGGKQYHVSDQDHPALPAYRWSPTPAVSLGREPDFLFRLFQETRFSLM